jgi:hypothetical protein
VVRAVTDPERAVGGEDHAGIDGVQIFLPSEVTTTPRSVHL